MRLIDADALVQKWYKINDIDEDDRGARFIGYTEIVRMINNAPTINEWIPCEERLPETHPYQIENNLSEQLDITEDYFMESDDVLICDINGNMFIASYEIDSPRRQYWVDSGGQQFKDVIAWMPLPKPYTGGDAE